MIRPVAAARWAVPAAGLGLCVVAVSVAGVDRVVVTTYSATSAAAGVVDVGTGLALVGAAAVGLAHPRTSARGVALGMLAVTWLAQDLVGWQDGPAWARSVGLVLVPFTLPLIAQVAQVARPVLAAAFGSAGIYSVGRALVRDPFRDPDCWSNCSVNTFLVRPLPNLVQVLDAWWPPISVALGLVVAGLCLERLRWTSTVARRSSAPVLAPAAAAALTLTAWQVLLWVNPEEDPRSPLFVGAFLLQAAGLTALAAGATLATARELATRQAVDRLVDLLGAAPERGSLGAALARSLGDPGLRVAYWVPDRDGYVDADGRHVDPTPGSGQVETAILRAGRPVAVLVHDRGVPIAAELERDIGAAARLAMDNERLRAAVLAHVADVADVRTRIVETADATRRRIERDLHDGAQQRLLAVSYELRLAAAAARDEGADDVLAAVAAGAETVRAAFAELRELAHGIFPSVLTESGLQPALRALAARAPLPLELHSDVDGRLPAAAETAGYFVVADAVARAEQRGATFVAVDIRAADPAIELVISDDGPAQTAEALVHVADRVGALGGRLEIADGGLRAVIPCAS